MVLAEELIAKGGGTLINDFYNSIKGKAKTEWQKFDWHTARREYFEKIEKDYGTTRILGKPEPVALEGIFTDVYLLDKPTAFRRFDILQLQTDPEAIKGEQKRISGLDLVKEGKTPRLYILGKPGAGKTTFLKYIAFKASRNEISKIPIFVSLKEWADCGIELMPFLVKQFDICDFPDAQPLIEYLLKMGLAIVLFDGLDETQQAGGKRDKIIQDIRDFSRKYDDSQVLVTCRIAATDYTFEEFTYLEVADFTEEQVNHYVEKWFADNAEKLEQFKAEFAHSENERLREMANTPLLLSLLCLNFEEVGTFPQRRVEIYEEGVRALLTKWDSSRNIKRDEIYKGLSLGRKLQMFARIAAQTFEKNEYFLPKRKLAGMITDYLSQLPDSPPKDDIDGEAVLRAIEAQHSIFVERAHEIYSFSHLTFQEYFAAKYTVENIQDGTLKRLLIYKNITDQRWREVILNTASLLDNADSLIRTIQETADRIIANDKKITAFLNWTDTKSKSITENRKIPLVSFAYIYLGIALDISHKIDNESAIKQSANLHITTNLYLSTHYITDEIDLDKKLDFWLALLISKYIRTSDTLNYSDVAVSIVKELMNDYWKNSQNSITEAFKKLTSEPWFYKAKSRRELIDKLLKFTMDSCNIGHQWSLSGEQTHKLQEYVKVNKVLVDCLKLAVVSDRQAIEDSLLSPPKKR